MAILRRGPIPRRRSVTSARRAARELRPHRDCRRARGGLVGCRRGVSPGRCSTLRRGRSPTWPRGPATTSGCSWTPTTAGWPSAGATGTTAAGAPPSHGTSRPANGVIGKGLITATGGAGLSAWAGGPSRRPDHVRADGGSRPNAGGTNLEPMAFDGPLAGRQLRRGRPGHDPGRARPRGSVALRGVRATAPARGARTQRQPPPCVENPGEAAGSVGGAPGGPYRRETPPGR